MLRRFPTMTQEKAEQYSEAMMSLASQARSVVRDLNPKVFVSDSSNLDVSFYLQNELKYLRVRAKRHEIMVAFGKQFISLEYFL